MASHSTSSGLPPITSTSYSLSLSLTSSPPSHPRGSSKSNVIRKLTSSSFNEKTSLDLDLNRPSDQQSSGYLDYAYASGSRSVHDLNSSSSGGNGNGNGIGFGFGLPTTSRRGYHQRSTSGTSQFSTATTGSTRNGSFQHPFQQTPRPYTPPLAAAGTGASGQGSFISEYSRETALPEESETRGIRTPSSLSNYTIQGASSSLNTLPPLRLQTKTATGSRLGFAGSQSNLHSTLFSDDLTSPTDTMSPSSAFRASIDKDRHYRLRSRSDVETRPHADTVRDLRRRFEEKEQAKEERAAREAVKALEKKNFKEAKTMEKAARKSTASERPRMMRDRTDSENISEKSGYGGDVGGTGFVGREYGGLPIQTPPHTDGWEQPRERGRHASATKKKTHSAWTTFMMWLRTRFLRISKKI
jgi:hypothetical protein